MDAPISGGFGFGWTESCVPIISSSSATAMRCCHLVRCFLVFFSAFLGQMGTRALASEPAVVDLGTRGQGEDWPTFLGPTGDGKSAERGLSTDWSQGGPRLVWSRRLAESYGIGSVSRGRYFQFDFDQGEARLICLHSETGALIWEFRYPSEYEDLYGYNRGPRCAPVVDGTRVYIYGVEGQLHCLQVTDGALMWQVDTTKQFGVVQNFFGVGSTPIVHEDLLIVMVGGSPAEDQRIPPGQLDRVTGNGSAIVALDKRTGQVRYKLSDELASYASLRLAFWDDRPWCFAFLRGGLLSFHPHDATIDFHVPWRASLLESVNASTPVVIDHRVFISEAYGPGGLLLEFDRDGVGEIWSDRERGRDQAMRTHWNTPIYHEGFLYGSSGRHTREAELRCVRWEDGKVMWSYPGLSRASLLYVDGHFVCLGEDGVLRLIRANPERFEQIAVLQPETTAETGPTDPSLPLLRYPAWAAPILSHGLLYVRGRDRVVCLELIPDPR